MTQQSHYWAYTSRKSLIEKDTCTPMFIASTFIIARIWKQSKNPLREEWMKKIWYILAIKKEYYSAIKRMK